MSRHLARDLLLVAEDLDGKGYLLVGVIRRAARLLAELEDEDRPRCRHCHRPLSPAKTGPPATYCGSPCRQAAYRARTRNVVGQ